MIGLGCMRLSTAADRDESRAIAVIHAALEAGATLLDTADAYSRDDHDAGHNERLIARALSEWTGDRSRITVATKGGIKRTGGAWINDGRAKHLQLACEASLRALGIDAIDLYQLHAVDPKTPIETSVRALARLQKEGKIRQIGLCNVTVSQIKAAQEIATIAAVQVSLSPLNATNLRNGVAEYCRDQSIRLVAYRPLGGERISRLARNATLKRIAQKHGESTEIIALAWLTSFGENVVPIPGATRVETAVSLARVAAVPLDADDLAALDAEFSGRLLRVPRAQRRPHASSGDVTIVMGMPGAGKTTVARDLESRGYTRLNRDELGGSLADLLPRLDAALADGRNRIVLDNTYPTRQSRNGIIETAWERGASVRCIWQSTSVADAQINSIHRMIEAHGSLPQPDEIRSRAKQDVRYLLPDAQFRYERTLEPPSVDEGFESVEVREFSRGASAHAHRALLLDLDQLPELALVAKWRAQGWLLFVHAWRPGASPQDTEIELARLRDKAGEIDTGHCVHEAGPPVCWCRKPIPGRAVEFAIRRRVALDKSIVVGGSAADRTMAERLGARYLDAGAFSAESG